MSVRPARARRHAGWRVLGAGTALAIVAFAVVAFAVVFSVGHLEASGPEVTAPVTVARDATLGIGHHHGFDTPSVHGLRSQPASRSRASVFAVLAVGVVVAALTRRQLLTGVRALARSFRHSGLRPGRGPPLPRIA